VIISNTPVIIAQNAMHTRRRAAPTLIT
jgi:hypothetical protein